jgi:hypothetical protein
MRRIAKAGFILSVVATVSFGFQRAQAAEDAAALAKALPEATVSLEQGLTTSEREGKPISGKFEIEDGALQLSVYTARDGKFTEVIVDHKSAAIKKAEPITEGEDLKDAKEQDAAMNAAKVPLTAATAQAVRANAGSIELLFNGLDCGAIRQPYLGYGVTFLDRRDDADRTIDRLIAQVAATVLADRGPGRRVERPRNRFVGPPFRTDDPEPAETQHWETNLVLLRTACQSAEDS